MLTAEQAVEQTRFLLDMRRDELRQLDVLHAYWKGRQRHPSVPEGARREVKDLAKMARVNLCRVVVAVPAQSLSVVGFRDRGSGSPVDEPVWDIWQANHLDRMQKPIYRAAFAYGVSYVTVLPGTPAPVIRGHSPRRMTAVYGEDPDWPVFALQVIPDVGRYRYRLFDETHIYELVDVDRSKESHSVEFVGAADHGSAVCPVVRFVNTDDLEDEPDSEIGAIKPLQDQLDETTFDLKVAERYAAFRQRYIIGWSTDDENEAIQLSQQRMMTFDADADQVRVGEFEQTDLKGYLDSRKATLENFGIVSQVPPHNLVGQMVNLSAEALVAAEVGHTRKIDDRETSFGESWEQTLRLAGAYEGIPVSEQAQIRWKDSEARSLSQTVDALGKMATMLKVPPQVLWSRIPGVTDQDVADWRAELVSTDPVAQLIGELERQVAPSGIDT